MNNPETKPRTVQPSYGNRILLLARKLDRGGAERQLVTLARELKLLGYDISVLTFYPGGALDEELLRAGIRLRSIGKRGRWDTLSFLHRTADEVRSLNPAVIYSFLDTPNILAAILRALVPTSRIIWSVRAAGMEMAHYDWLMRFVSWIEARLSQLPNLIVSNSEAGREWALNRGFVKTKIVVIQNGIDTNRFRADGVLREKYRREWSVTPCERLVGIVGRLDVMKDHENFLRAASKVAGVQSNVKFVCVGRDNNGFVDRLKRVSAALGLEKKLIWIPEMAEIVGAYSAIDVLCSSSAFGEGFPNVVAEAMSCGVPCVVTNVGDSKWIVGDYGEVVEPRDSEALSQGILRLLRKLDSNEIELNSLCRRWIDAKFSTPLMVARTLGVLLDGGSTLLPREAWIP